MYFINLKQINIFFNVFQNFQTKIQNIKNEIQKNKKYFYQTYSES